MISRKEAEARIEQMWIQSHASNWGRSFEITNHGADGREDAMIWALDMLTRLGLIIQSDDSSGEAQDGSTPTGPPGQDNGTQSSRPSGPSSLDWPGQDRYVPRS